jgi:hypothetical protein
MKKNSENSEYKTDFQKKDKRISDQFNQSKNHTHFFCSFSYQEHMYMLEICCNRKWMINLIFQCFVT